MPQKASGTEIPILWSLADLINSPLQLLPGTLCATGARALWI